MIKATCGEERERERLEGVEAKQRKGTGKFI
jgi:hypothetical protein